MFNISAKLLKAIRTILNVVIVSYMGLNSHNELTFGASASFVASLAVFLFPLHLSNKTFQFFQQNTLLAQYLKGAMKAKQD